MSNALPTPPDRYFSREQFRAWVDAQPRGRFERVNGRIVAMAAERLRHVEVKYKTWLVLREAIARAGLPCRAFGDGATVEIDEHFDYEPDALVTCAEGIDLDGVAAPSPVIVVEVTSPRSRSLDTGAKLADYFRVPSIRHYLLLRTDPDMLVHHCREADGRIETRLCGASGTLRLDPPGLEFSIEAVFQP